MKLLSLLPHLGKSISDEGGQALKRRQFLIVLFALLAIAAGIVGTLTIRTFLNQKNTGNASASLYITGTRVIPTVRVSTITNCDPTHIPGVTSDTTGGTGLPAIKPHLCSIPTFTEEDVRQFMSSISSFTSFRIEQTSVHFTVTRVLFVTNQMVNDILNADTGVTENTLVVCYVEVYGDFTVASPFSSKDRKQTILHHGQMVFDGLTGNMLVIGVVS
jgi:hypothetical protein